MPQRPTRTASVGRPALHDRILGFPFDHQRTAPTLKNIIQALLKLAFAIALTTLLVCRAYADEPAVSLFKVITVKDEVVVGLPRETLAGMGHGTPLDVFAAELQRRGQMSAWQYASTKNAQRELVMSALRRVNFFCAGTARIEPYSSSLKVVPPN